MGQEVKLSEWVEKRRKSLGRSQREVCKRGGLQRNLVSRIELGQIPRPRIDIIEGLSRGLDLPSDFLYVQCGVLPPDIHRWLLKFDHPDFNTGFDIIRAEIERAK
jgi:transcriptional regulator with XRE-family HTH domain